MDFFWNVCSKKFWSCFFCNKVEYVIYFFDKCIFSRLFLTLSGFVTNSLFIQNRLENQEKEEKYLKCHFSRVFTNKMRQKFVFARQSVFQKRLTAFLRSSRILVAYASAVVGRKSSRKLEYKKVMEHESSSDYR